MLILSQFTGLYYTFDESNQYRRAPLFLLSYVFPIVIIVLLLSVILQHHRRISDGLYISLVMFHVIPICASIVQLFSYGVSITDFCIAIMCILLYFSAMSDQDQKEKRANRLEIEHLKDEQEKIQILFGQTSEALVRAIDAKDNYTRGHSTRVARYSRMIAAAAGKTEEECEDIYYAGLLHDVGKIGIPDSIISKPGKLTEEEYEVMKSHPVIGYKILARIEVSPLISEGAHYHHERYDGKGYPDGLKGEDIPEIARIIAVADAYDGMTCKGRYRNYMSQTKVREEIVKGIETQFDPKFARIMLSMIDRDVNYEMKESENEVSAIAGGSELDCDSFGSSVSEAFRLTPQTVKIRLKVRSKDEDETNPGVPSIIMFDSRDARVHFDKKRAEDMHYSEYGRIRFDGEVEMPNVREKKIDIKDKQEENTIDAENTASDKTVYEIEAVRYEDHVMITLNSKKKKIKAVMALQNSIKYSYIAITGENCFIYDVSAHVSDDEIGDGFIPRLADKFVYTDGPTGDLPNIQFDDYRNTATPPVRLKDGTNISFHTKTFPYASLVWHCPYINLYTSYKGNDHYDLALIRLDGEVTVDGSLCKERKSIINKTGDFESWDVWKEKNKEGFDCNVSFFKKSSYVTVFTENLGISVNSYFMISDKVKDINICLTGDECALTNIKVNIK
ncbi:MAG: HD-GYP domain-containing protein [Lachnospiraceae bacterium]|nr:HD-GYP domain-containing protein [Lachnospiraceae bacterium]